MARFGFVGPAYRSQSVNANAQMCMNFYVENDESGSGKSAMQLYPTPGSVLFSAGTQYGPLRAQATINGRLFVVDGTNFQEVSSAGVRTTFGQVLNDAKPASFGIGPTFLSIAAGGGAYSFKLDTNTFGTIDTSGGPALQGPIVQMAFLDGYFIALLANSNRFQLSALEDASSWDPLDIAEVSVYPDNVTAMIVDHRELWMCGKQAAVGYSNTGNPLFPLDVIPGAFIEQGTLATWGLAKIDNTVFSIGGDVRGAGMAWRQQGYLPVRISNHAIETAWQGYATISDAIAYAYQDQGHSFYVVYFPSANKTWVYDVATQMWHERGFFTLGAFVAHRSQNHSFVFDKHLVGDWKTGNIYQMKIPTQVGSAWTFADDFGNSIHRIRRAPHISAEEQFLMHQSLQVDMETGLGPQPPLLDGNGSPRGPVMTLRWSDDGGHSWSNGYDRDCGQAGQYVKRVIWRRLGRSRNRVYEVSFADAVPCRIVDAYLVASPGFEPRERLASQLRKQA